MGSVRRATHLDRPMAPTKMCVTRLTSELKAFRADPPPLAPLVHVSEKEILDWYILLEGPPSSPYEGGWYVMRIKFHPFYPYEAPAFMMLRPTGDSPKIRACARRSGKWRMRGIRRGTRRR